LPGSDVQMARLAQGLEATSDSKPDTNADPGLDAGAVSMKELLHQLPLGDEAGDLEEQLRNRFESEGAGQPAKAGAAPSAAVIAPTLQSVPLPQAPPLAPLQSANLPLAARRAPQSQQRLLTPGFDSTVQVFQQSEQLNQQHFDQMKQKMDGMKTKLEEMKTQNFKSSN